jgi:hypothetical protein
VHAPGDGVCISVRAGSAWTALPRGGIKPVTDRQTGGGQQ